MPCTYDDYGAGEREQRAELDVVTRLLCALCKDLSVAASGLAIIDAVEGGALTTWLEKHKKVDLKRNLVTALGKLTEDEHAALRHHWLTGRTK